MTDSPKLCIDCKYHIFPTREEECEDSDDMCSYYQEIDLVHGGTSSNWKTIKCRSERYSNSPKRCGRDGKNWVRRLPMFSYNFKDSK